ncbi:MAG: anthranilate synthase component I [Candidatus Raymondbacteria bacterium RifOxyA12_full_50_37]|uniref:Anthranilate synthase component 1 n=1 Tax=Candidatus Raymondbacteria bacterium RIFOXYD12_FULL_49_13 TaxID=1817890 RepID=A0A1F7F5Q2_UNCRA|nr:MAG: anthranilate synthase component I [Candidatus Raymondbacteria bacterium RifOxyA12_full_50_37]OGJ89177.1 MAG: anthranilate synthase component I [Candidatus Raymondbacteria bacterium RIFOXYA2_FULL_49_16]OGJ96659.1 MAG: anthranilate synthase component I [Candidatus Raymondbacteria bacterium RIFOXYC2_FULL_50_21]OGJ99996.1 MAG: anthranilate synthase component I [Candidatus Raymondbacteria bacterium RifOxyB12_full_50_8]OGK00096.1 MAG: anthranilate synthase component I [Candidatus Raymondbacte
MNIKPTYEEAACYAGSYGVVPLSLEVYSDMETPITLFKRFQKNDYCFLLESVEGGEKWGRYSFLGRNPFLTVESRQGVSRIRNERTGVTSEVKGNPVETLHGILEKYRSPSGPDLPRFNGGAVGFFGYDLIRYYECLPNTPKDDLMLPESHFMFTDEVLVCDHFKQKLHIIVNMHMGPDIQKQYNVAAQRIMEIYNEITSTRGTLAGSPARPQKSGAGKQEYTSNVSKEQFCANVTRAKEYIRNGDIFQVVLSQRLCVESKEDPFDVYRVLRVLNPSPYMYFLKFNNYYVVGASPEMLTRIEDSKVETCPIAGTRKRGQNPEQDDALALELLADEKELAEHRMLVDLSRNDLGRVCDFGTVQVKDPLHVERYSHVMHIVTNVNGRLRKDKTPFDALMSVLPAGTLSGAPKIRAMEIIDEMETVKRGTYGGAIGYLSFNGNLDSCITIRTILFKNNKAYVQSGAGIVADSVPETEYEETLNKARALLKALAEAGEIQ